ncbi:MAG TPA: flavodoxin domain-containing protein [Jiangellaceae bacterium]
MKVLVGYASRHGTTAGIAERIATRLREEGLSADARPVAEVSEIGEYDAFVIGAAAYMFHWLKDATRFVKRHHRLLADRPLWLFSSGPLGTDLVDEEGRDIFEATRPKEFDELDDLVHPSGERVFFGAWDPDAPPVGLGERMVRRMPAASAAIPAGDFRDWPAIDAWAAEIAHELDAAEAVPSAGPG